MPAKPFLFFLLISGHFSVAQDSVLDYFSMDKNSALDREIRKIDSLITFTELDAAEEKINELYKVLNQKYPGNKYVEKRALVLLMEGLLKDKQYQHNNALSVYMEVLKKAEKNNLHRIACHANIHIALNHSKAGNFDLAYKYLEDARKVCEKYKLNDLYSTIYIRYGQMHRHFGFEKKPAFSEQIKRLEQLGFRASADSAFYYTQKAIAFAEKYNVENDVNDGYVVLGILNFNIGKYSESSSYYLKSLAFWKKTNNFQTVTGMYHNVALNYMQAGKLKEALIYNDSAMLNYKDMFVYHKYNVSKQRAAIYKQLGLLDSAYHYLDLAYEDREKVHNEAELSTTKALEEQYQNAQKESTIKIKNQQMLFIMGLLGVIAFASVMLYRKNRQVNRQNKIIGEQLIDLSKTLEQKQVLLSELQHRVKNNLQHVISILEIQKESVDFNNIDELIRGNQNRIHSMALLHKKLNMADNANDVDLKRYISELAELVKDSYDNRQKKVSLNTKCAIENISLEKALPIGLIITELVSNSMKHAFRKRNIGIIQIEISRDQKTNQLYYADNGDGFDFNKPSEKGLGQEIIKGLIDQLNGDVEARNNNGFELIIKFGS